MQQQACCERGAHCTSRSLVPLRFRSLLLWQTRDLSESHSHSSDSSPGDTRLRLDLLVLLLVGALLCLALWSEYDVNLPWLGLQALRRALDPGPIQCAQPQDAGQDVAEAGRQAAEAALSAVRERMGKAA